MADLFRVFYLDQTHSCRQRLAETQILFLLSGRAEVFAEDTTYLMQPEDIILINSYDAYQITGSQWKAAVLAFRPEKPAAVRSESAGTARFSLRSCGNTYSTVYDFTRYCMAQLIIPGALKEQFFSSLSIFYALLSHLTTNFPAPPVMIPQHSQLTRDRLLSLTEYMEDHYREALTLNETADAFGLSAPYLSSFFKKQTGRSFMEFYNEIRLSHAVDDLLAGNNPLESVAVENGFRDPRAFSALFRKKYQMLPNEFRKKQYQNITGEAQKGQPSDPSAEAAVPESLLSLAKYRSVFHEKTDFSRSVSENPRIIDAGSVNVCSSGKSLSHNYHKMICVGAAKQFLYAEIQALLRQVQQEIGFEYVKFHGLLSDDMMVYSEDSYGIARYSFTMIDKVLDFMLSIRLRPLCQLSFMPIALAQDPSRLVDFYHFNTSPPKDMKKWTDLVSALTRHLVSRYGEAEVKTWPFCVWNEPDETVDQFAWDDRELFFDFYCQTWRAVKEICPEISFGTPSMLLSVQKEEGWAGEFLFYARSHGCSPDFLNIHYYDNSLFGDDAVERIRGEKGYSTANMERSFPLTADPYAFGKFINNIKTLMRKHQLQDLPIYLTEWNLTISHRDLINDTCFKSCHLVKNLLENYDRLQSYSYWCLTDFEEELQVPEKLYHGGLGLFTYNGIPKANYNAFRLLGKLGRELLSRGNGYFITRTGPRIAILLYNYEHYSRLFASGFRSNQISKDRYTAFEDLSTAQFTVRLAGLSQAAVVIKEWFVNQTAGSSYDAWAQMGSGSLPSSDNTEILMQRSLPGLYLHQETVEKGILTLHARMAPLEIRLIEIE